ncbi:NADH-quinone oxidoreductase subunit NuoN [Curvivirga sp.]|uniref:NADH-quinone oxidoreductase subunit NuoN n=1 Tax=Curvivirga sp. TaxID=2856848 RepID=UPI003B58DA1B
MTELPVLFPAYPEIFLAIAIMALMMIGAYSKAENTLGAVSALTQVSFVVTAGLVLFVVGGTTQLAMNDLFIVDQFAVYMKLLILLASLLAVTMSNGFIRREGMAKFEYPILIAFATLGMMMMVSANDLMSLYIGLELQSLSLYVMAAFQRDNSRSTEAGLKYFVLGALSSGMLLYGMSMVYGFAGSTQFDALANAFTVETGAHMGVIVGLVFMVAGLAFKISAVPFHMWTPDVYEGAPTPVTAFFAVAPKVAAMALLIRVLVGPFGGLVSEWSQVIVVLSILSMLIGSFAAIAQSNIKRLMAYSSIGHIGFALIGLAAGTEGGVEAVLIYLAIYLVMNIGTFACILNMKVGGRMVENISDLAGLSKNNPVMAMLIMVFMFSMAGIPPMAGFMSKLFVFKAAVDAGLITLTVIGAVTSVVSAFYYLRVIKVMYFDDPAEKLDSVESGAMKLILAVTGIVTATMILYMPVVTDPAIKAASSLFGG